MNKIKIYSIIVLIVTLTVFNYSCSWFNDNDEEDMNDTLVEIIDQDVLNQNSGNGKYVAGDYKIPNELIYNDKSDDFLVSKLYPIGWSNDGKFAYIVEPADEGSGFYLFELIVFDLVNNKITWSWKLDETEEGNIETTWKANYENFKENLNKYEITQLANFELKKGKTTFKGNEYQITLDTKTMTQPDFGFDVIKELKISIESPEIGTKEIYAHKEDEFSMLVGAFVPGYLLSPSSERIAVVCQMERWGYEGPPNVVFFELIGSDLLRGFSANSGS